MRKDKTSIVGLCGVEEGEVEELFEIFIIEQIEVLDIWEGYYVKDNKKI
jgi:hypothetical protein